jgi:hypothetical protein
MADDLSVAFERLRTSTQQLNAICDSAAQVIRETEAFLEECHVGIPAYVEVKRDDVTGEGRYFDLVHLSYARYKGKFRISVVNTPASASGPEDEAVRPWSESSRDEKLETLEFLPKLLIELAKSVDERKEKAKEAITTVTSLLQLPAKRKGA